MKVLKLHSPLGAKPISYTWPLTSNCENVKSKKNTVPAIVQTMQWVCKDYPEMQFALQNNILVDYDINSYESMKNVCNRFNKTIEILTNLEKGTSLSQKRIKTQASRDLLRHIMQQVYIRAVDDPKKLNDYKPFSPEVYGETSYDYVCQIIDSIQATPQDVFIDLGSGVGQVVLQMAASTPCKLCIGIECSKNPNMFALKMDKYFQEWMAWFGKKYGNYELIQGNFLHEKFQSKIRHCSIFFTNNILFGPYINYRLQERFLFAKDGTKIVSSRNFCQRNFRSSNRNKNDIGRIMTVVQLPAWPDSVSWTGKPFSFYLHVIDRTKQQEYCNQMSTSTIIEESENNGPTEKKKICKSRSVPPSELMLNSRRTLAEQKIDRPRSVPPKEEEDFFPELVRQSRRTLDKQKIDRPRSVPPSEIMLNSRRTLVEHKINRPRSVPPKEEEEIFPGLVQQSQKIDRPRSVQFKEKEDYQGSKQNSQRTLAKQKIERSRSVPPKEKEEHHTKLVKRILLKQMIDRSKSAPAKEKEKYCLKLVQNSQSTSVKEKQEYHPKLIKKIRSKRFALANEKEEHHVKSQITSVEKNVDLRRPAPIKGKKNYHPQAVQNPLSLLEEPKSFETDYSSCKTSENNAKVVGMLTKNHRSILKTSLNNLENSDKNPSSCYENTTRNLNELPKKVDKFLETAKDRINKPVSPIYEEFEQLNYSGSENTDQELNSLQELDSMESLDSCDISVSSLISSQSQNTDTPLFNKTLELNDSGSVVSVDSFSNNKKANFQANIVRPNAPTPRSIYQRRLAKILALLQKQANAQKTHSMMIRKKTVLQSIAARNRLNNYLRNKIKKYAAIISKNNQNDSKLNHTNNSKVIKRIITEMEYPEISPKMICIEKNTEKIYTKTKGKNICPKVSTGSATKIVCPETPTRTVPTEMVRSEIPSGMLPTAQLTEKIRPEIYREIIRSKISTGSATEIVRLKTPTRTVPTKMVRSEIPSGMLPTAQLTEKIRPETYREIIRSKISTGSATEIVRLKTPTRTVPTKMVRSEIPSGMLPTAQLTEKIRPETYREIIRSKISTGSATEIVHSETSTKLVPTEMVHPEIPSGRGNTKLIYPEINSKITRPKFSTEIATEVKCPDKSTKMVPIEMERLEIPSGMVCIEKRPEMLYPELSTRKISTGVPSINYLASELSNHCKQFQRKVQCNTINNDEIVAFQNAINEAIAKNLEQDIEKNKTLQTNCRTKEAKINYARRMKQRDMRNYLKRKLFINSNQIKKVTLKRKLQRKLLSKIKNTSHNKTPQRKICEDNDDNISVSSVASPEYTPLERKDVEFFFKRFLESNER